MDITVDGLLKLASDLDKKPSGEANNEEDSLPEAEKLATLLNKVAELDEENVEEEATLDKVAEAVSIYEFLDEEGLV